MTKPRPPTGQADSLRHIMDRNDLRNKDVAEMLCVSLKTVESWLADTKAPSYRNMPPRHLNMLSFALPGFLGKRRNAAKAAKKGS